MKKYFNFAFASAIALIGTCGFTACSSSDDVAEVAQVPDNPTYDPVTQTVTAQFVLNIASNTKATRSGSTTVQAGGENFRGIDNTLLFAFNTSGKVSSKIRRELLLALLVPVLSTAVAP